MIGTNIHIYTHKLLESSRVVLWHFLEIDDSDCIIFFQGDNDWHKNTQKLLESAGVLLWNFLELDATHLQLLETHF